MRISNIWEEYTNAGKNTGNNNIKNQKLKNG